MKKQLLTLLLLIGLGLGAQDYVEIRKSLWPNSPQDVRAGKRITFWPGSRMSVASGITSTAKIEPSLIGTNTPPGDVSYQSTGQYITGIITDLEVGSIMGRGSVSGTGGSIYTIPIAVPAGLNGMQPEISLSYNSFGGIGLLGEGFNLNGLSVVTRGGKTLYHDGKLDDVEYLPKDTYYFNGQRLVIKSGFNGTDGAEYRTFIESFTKILSHESTAYGPRKFTAETNSGQKLKFGSTVNSRIEINDPEMISVWLIDEVKDPFGNFIHYEYLHDEGSAYIKKIMYNGNDNGLAPYSEIVFHYEKREDEIQGYEKGKKTSKRFLLTGVSVYHRQMLLKEYKVDYAYNTNSVLRSIKLYNAEGEEVNATQFEFGDDQRVIDATEVSELSSRSLISAEINGDGRTDLFTFYHWDDWPNQKYYYSGKAYINHGAGNFQEIELFPEFESSEPMGNGLNRPIFNSAVGDFNGDGYGDLAIVKKAFGLDKYTVQFFEFNPNINDFNSPINKTISFAWVNASGIQLTVADFNKDGIDDLLCNREIIITENIDGEEIEYNQVASVFITKHQSNRYEVLSWWTSNSQGSPASTFNPYGQQSANADSIYVTDINGNGIPEIAMVDNQTYFYEIEIDYSNANGHGQCKFIPLFSTSEINKTHKIWFGEFNGDGKTDVLRYSPPLDNWQILYSTGSNSSPFNLATYNLSIFNPPSDQDAYIYKVADFDGDGLTDVMETRYDATTRYCTVYYKILDKSSSFGFLGKRYSTPKEGMYWLERAHHIGDFDGNGAADILVCHPYISSNSRLIDFGRNNSSLLKRVRDGFGNITTFHYEFFSPYSGSQGFQPLRLNQLTYPHSIRVSPMQLVKTKTVAHASAHTETETYDYTDPVFHGTGLGFLGFMYRNVANTVSNTTIYSESSLIGETLLPTLTAVQEPGTVISQSNTSYRFVDVVHSAANPAPTKNKVLQKYKEVHKDLVRGISSKTEVKTYDPHYNPSLIEESSFNDLSQNNLCQKTAKAFTYTSSAGVWYPSFPEVITVTKTLPGQASQSFQQKYTYFSATGKVKDNISFYGLPKALSVSSAYDDYGNTVSLTKTTQGVSRSTTSNYAQGTLHMIKEVNNIGQEKGYVYHQLFDKTVQETDILGNKVTLEYGGNGEVKKVTSPTGVTTTSKTFWASGHSDSPSDALFYQIKESSEGSPDVIVFYNSVGQVIREITFGLNREKIFTDSEYDSRGRLKKKSEPYFANQSPVWVIYTYGSLGRINQISSPGNSLTYSYSGTSSTITNSQTGRYKTSTTDASGKLLSVNDNGSAISYKYGQTSTESTTTITGGANSVVQKFNIYGNQTSLGDADAGQTSYDYNGFGELVQQIENGKLWTLSYDKLGRIETKTGPDGAYEYEYGQSGPNSLGQISKATSPEGIVYQYYYDEYGRLSERKEEVDEINYSFYYGYDNVSNPITIKYPSGFEIRNVFDNNGYLTEVKRNTGVGSIWRAERANAMGELEEYKLGNGLTTTKTFDSYHYPKTIQTGDIQDLEYYFDPASGNLKWRKDYYHSLTENFEYDAHDQLNSISSTNISGVSIDYNAGRVFSKSDVGDYSYQSDNSQVTEIINNEGSIPEFTQEVDYTPFNKILQINENVFEARFTYGPNQQRKVMEVDEEGVPFYSRTYVGGDYEIEDHRDKGKRRLHYISGGDGLTAIYVLDENDEWRLYYIHKDYLGSILAVTDEEGELVEEYSFDAWGRRRNPEDWTYDDLNVQRLFDRGFTAHEHLFDGFNIINMNGRIYDPTVAMMMSPDNFIQDPGNSVNYNRYAYAVNNPLKYTDPSGEAYIWDDVIVGVIGFAYGYVSHGITTDDWGWSAVGAGGISAATFLLGYYTGGAYSQASIANGYASVISTQTGQRLFTNQALTVAVGYAARGTATRVVSSFAPSVSFETGMGTISASPYAGIGAQGFVHGINVGLNVPAGESSVGLNAGAGTNGSSISLSGMHKSGVGYYWSSVGRGTNTQQATAGLIISKDNFSMRFENDFLTGQGEDRWRTGGVELSIGDFVLGTQVYTNDPQGEESGVEEQGKSLLLGSNWWGNGAWKNGVVSDSPVYLGYKNGNSIHRIGVNSPYVQDITQNGIHKFFYPGRQNFYNEYTNYRGVYYHTGVYNPHSIYYY